MHRHVFSESRYRQLQVIAAATVFVVVAAVLAGLVARSINTLTATADAIDDGRARHTAAGALQSLRKQLGAAVRDHVAAEGHTVDWVRRLDEATEHVQAIPYDLVLLDRPAVP